MQSHEVNKIYAGIFGGEYFKKNLGKSNTILETAGNLNSQSRWDYTGNKIINYREGYLLF